MATQTISSYIAAGYALSSSYDTLVITASGGVGGTGVSAALPSTIQNYGLVKAGGAHTGVALADGGAVTNAVSGSISGGPGLGGTGVYIAGGFGVVANLGSIMASDGGGVILAQGGNVANGSAGDLTAAISAAGQALFISGGAGTITNFGTLTSTGAAGVFLFGGYLTNGSTEDAQAAIRGKSYGVYADALTMVTNFATIQAWIGDGVLLQGGGAVGNGANTGTRALIEGRTTGVAIQGGIGRVTNYGTIDATGLDATNRGVALLAGGSLTNGSPSDLAARIAGYKAVVGSGAAATVVNFGTIQGLGDLGRGVELQDGGTVTNGVLADTAALIAGALGVGLTLAGTVANFGTIRGAYAAGVALQAGGRVINGAVTDHAALIEGFSGLVVGSGVTSVTNFGTIRGTDATYLSAGVNSEGGNLTNGGLNDTTALIEGYAGVIAAHAQTIANFGTIRGLGYAQLFSQYPEMAIYLAGGGTITNGSSGDTVALIAGYEGVKSANAAATINNFGAIISTGASFFGVSLGSGGGVVTNGSATDQTAVIKGNRGVLETSGPGTVINFGTIQGTGGTAVQFGQVGDRLVVEAGSAFLGMAIGGGGTLELANGVGTLTGVVSGGNVTVAGSMAAATFTSFGTVKVDATASFALVGAASIAAGQSLIIAGTVSGAITVGGILAGTGTLSLTGASAFNAGTTLTVAKVTESGAVTSATVNVPVLTYAGQWIQTSGTLSVSKGDRINFTGAGGSFAGTLAGAGTIAFTAGSDTLAGATLTAATVIVNAAVTLTDTIYNSTAVSVTTPSLTIAAAGVTLYGGGRVNLSNTATNKISGATAGATLVNYNNRITGAGALGGGQMTLINEAAGVINGSLSLALTIDTGAATIVNFGFIEATGAGGVTVQSAVNNIGTLLVTTGVLTVNGAVFGGGTVKIVGGTAYLAGAFSQNVKFAGASGVLELAHSQAYAGSVAGFSKTGSTQLDLNDIAFGASTKASYAGTTASGVLTVTDGTHTAHIKLTGDYTASAFVVATDGHGGTLVHDPVMAVTSPARTGGPGHAFIAAMAGFGAAAGPSATATAGDWRERPLALAAPRMQFA